jgi:3-isopropylmalate/(R)-2-methylmalate dehydratase small subunit
MQVFKYGDDINTDMLFPGKYTYTCATPEEILPHLLEDLDQDFVKKVKPGDLVFAGKNFGCGSSREQPVLGLAHLKIAAVVAESFARIFYRAAINQGLILIECPEAVKAYRDGAKVEFNLEEGRIMVDDRVFKFPCLPDEILAIRDAGGLLNHVRKTLAERKK